MALAAKVPEKLYYTLPKLNEAVWEYQNDNDLWVSFSESTSNLIESLHWRHWKHGNENKNENSNKDCLLYYQTCNNNDNICEYEINLTLLTQRNVKSRKVTFIRRNVILREMENENDNNNFNNNSKNENVFENDSLLCCRNCGFNVEYGASCQICNFNFVSQALNEKEKMKEEMNKEEFIVCPLCKYDKNSKRNDFCINKTKNGNECGFDLRDYRESYICFNDNSNKSSSTKGNDDTKMNDNNNNNNNNNNDRNGNEMFSLMDEQSMLDSDYAMALQLQQQFGMPNEYESEKNENKNNNNNGKNEKNEKNEKRKMNDCDISIDLTHDGDDDGHKLLPPLMDNDDSNNNNNQHDEQQDNNDDDDDDDDMSLELAFMGN